MCRGSGKPALLYLHPGTQLFRREASGDATSRAAAFSNLDMGEWESYFSREYSWPRYAEYRHALLPHGAEFTHADRVRASAAFNEPLICRVAPPGRGDLPASKGFLAVGPAGVALSAFRKNEGRGYEIRVVEVQGEECDAHADFAIPTSGASETNLLGQKVADADLRDGRLSFRIEPWKIRTFEVV